MTEERTWRGRPSRKPSSRLERRAHAESDQVGAEADRLRPGSRVLGE